MKAEVISDNSKKKTRTYRVMDGSNPNWLDASIIADKIRETAGGSNVAVRISFERVKR